MEFKTKITIVSAALSIGIVVVGYFIMTNNSAARDEAIRQAESFRCGGLTVMTPATHIKTGAKYTFPTSCLPDGWESDR